MSAWAEIVNSTGSDDWRDLCERALKEIQREQSRRNARKIRSADYYSHVPEGGYDHQRDAWVSGRDDAANLIDPEVSR